MQGTLFYHNLKSSHFLRERNTDHKAIPRTKKHDFLCAGKDVCSKMLLDATYMKSIINKNSKLGLQDKRKPISVKSYLKVINLPFLPKLILDGKVFLLEGLQISNLKVIILLH